MRGDGFHSFHQNDTISHQSDPIFHQSDITFHQNTVSITQVVHHSLYIFNQTGIGQLTNRPLNYHQTSKILSIDRFFYLSSEHQMATGHIIESRLNTQDGFPDGEVAACCKKLQIDSERIKTLGRLWGRGPKLVQDAASILKALQTSRQNIIYQEFLGDILHHCGRGITLLCAASLGKQRVTRMGEKDRISFVGVLKNSLSRFYHPILDTLATAYEISSANG